MAGSCSLMSGSINIVLGWDAAPLLDYSLSDVRPEGSEHTRQGAPDLAVGARDRKVQDRLDRNPDKMRVRRQTGSTRSGP
jgi:hypothetical protein